MEDCLTCVYACYETSGLTGKPVNKQIFCRRTNEVVTYYQGRICGHYQLTSELQARQNEAAKAREDLINNTQSIINVGTKLLIWRNENKQEAELRASEQRSTMKASKWVAALLAIFLGWVGAQKFYLGHPKQGVILLLVSITGSIILIGPIITSVIGIVEGIIYLISSPEKFQETYVTGNKIWF